MTSGSRTTHAADAEVLLPPHEPEDVLGFVEFCQRMNERMRALREHSLPRAAVTLPDEFDDVVLRSLADLKEQAEAALAAGGARVSCRLRITPQVTALARWSRPRMDLFVRLTRAGLAGPDWQAPIQLWAEMMRAVLDRIDE